MCINNNNIWQNYYLFVSLHPVTDLLLYKTISMIMNRHVFILILLFVSAVAQAQSFRVSSPDGATHINLLVHRNAHGRSKFARTTKKTLDVVHNRESLLRNQAMDLTLKAEGHRYNFGEAEITAYNELKHLIDDPEVPGDCVKGVNGLYNGIVMETNIGVTIELRVYNNGVAYRYKVAKRFDEYKILTITPVFPGEVPIAILGTYSDGYDFDWNVMQISNEDDGKCTTNTINNKPKVRGIVSWRDALSSASVGTTFNWFTGDTWKNIAQTQSITADITYKYLYGAVTYSPCIELLYIYYGEDYSPFTRVMGSIHSWSLGTRLGFNLPIQDGYNVWSITPYVGASLMHMLQHGETRPTYNDVSPHHRYLVGPGLRVQCAVRERLTIGFSYEYQFFTGKKTPDGMNSLGMSLGWQF